LSAGEFPGETARERGRKKAAWLHREKLVAVEGLGGGEKEGESAPVPGEGGVVRVLSVGPARGEKKVRDWPSLDERGLGSCIFPSWGGKKRTARSFLCNCITCGEACHRKGRRERMDFADLRKGGRVE